MPCYCCCDDGVCIPACCTAEGENLIKMEKTQRKPKTIFLVNRGSGGHQGGAIQDWAKTNGYQNFDLLEVTKSANSPNDLLYDIKPILENEEFRKVIIVAGGDGTLSWALSIIDMALEGRDFDITNPEAQSRLQRWYLTEAVIRFIPLGTGNDICRVLGNGTSFPGLGKMQSIVSAAQAGGAPETIYDIWSAVHTNMEGEQTQWMSNRMCAYLSIGGSATAAHAFHQKRANNPDRYNSQWKNKLAWGMVGASAVFSSEPKLAERANVETTEGELDLPSNSRDCLLLNVNSFSAGINFFKTSTYRNKQQKKWSEPAVGDGLFEMYSGFGSSAVASSMVFGRRAWSRLSQTNGVTIELKEAQHVHLDGEAWEEQPGTITVSHHVAIRMLLGGHRPRNVNTENTYIHSDYVRESIILQ